jgi:thiamine-phosphate pyrophosphorylase
MNGQVLRILDANANRAREALRVIEDYARFVLDDDGLCGSLKALRTIEEHLKVESPIEASIVEDLRYRFYEIERRVALTLRPTAGRFAQVRLYVLVTESICRGPWQDVARAAIAGGADCLQLREKNLDGGELLTRAREFVAICKTAKVISIINDRPDVALIANADGVHVGQADLPAAEVRKLISTQKILGVSTHNLNHAKQAVLDGADYIGVGPFFRSETKTRDFVAGPAYAREVVEHIRIPAVAIAGITDQNVDEVLATGIKAVAVTAAVAGCDDPRAAAQRLKQKLV